MRSKYVSQMLLDNGIRPPRDGALGYRVRHCPGLYLRVGASGAASWRVMYRVGGKQIKEVLGTLAAIPRLADAVSRAQASLEKARAGVNPVAARRLAAERAAANTVQAAADRFLAQPGLRAKTTYGYRQTLTHDVLPQWGGRALSSITKGDMLELLNDRAARRERPRKGAVGGAAPSANHARKVLVTFFRWCVANALLTDDPSEGVRKPIKETSRDRILTDDEIRAFWAATEPRNTLVSWGALLRMLLLLGQRRTETAGMRWSEVNLDERVWEIPAARTKNAKRHIVHLSDLAIAELARVPRRGDLVFSGTGATPASGFSRAKRNLDDAMGVDDWVVHNLRRTATSGMARLGVAPHVCDKILNHTAGTITGVARVYNRFEYLDERKAALEAWSRFVAGLVGIGDENIVPLRRA